MTATVDAARAVVADEQGTVRAERAAFEAFDRRVAELSPVTVSTGPPVVADPRRNGRSLERVRTAYAETVMSTPHYDSTYGDDVAESLAVEFGDDLAAALVDGTALTPEVRNAVRAATATARHEREAFLDVLDREDASLATAAGELAEVRAGLAVIDDRPLRERGFDALRSVRSQVVDLERRIERLATRRQETIRDHRRDLPGVPTDLPEYLYADLDATYPVLSVVAHRGTELRRARRRIERAIASTA